MSQGQTRREGFLAEMGLGPLWMARVAAHANPAIASAPEAAGMSTPISPSEPAAGIAVQAKPDALPPPAASSTAPVKRSAADNPSDAWSDEELATAWSNALPLHPAAAIQVRTADMATGRQAPETLERNGADEQGADADWRPAPMQKTAAMASDNAAANAPGAAEIAGMNWEQLQSAVATCVKCKLCHSRTKTVFGTGDRQARWLFVGEGPGRNEDQQGEPFVGPAGKLLDNMLGAMQLRRGDNAYIANIVKCRPTGPDGRDRPPEPDEVAACMPYLERQIALLQPARVLALGKTAAVSLLALPPATTLSGLRGKIHEHGGLPVIATFHPAYLLRKLSDKAKSWSDLCLAMARYGASQGPASTSSQEVQEIQDALPQHSAPQLQLPDGEQDAGQAGFSSRLPAQPD